MILFFIGFTLGLVIGVMYMCYEPSQIKEIKYESVDRPV